MLLNTTFGYTPIMLTDWSGWLPNRRGLRRLRGSNNLFSCYSALATFTEAARVAGEIGASVFVGHFNTIDPSETTVSEILEHPADLDIILTIENLSDLYADNSPNLGNYLAIVGLAYR